MIFLYTAALMLVTTTFATASSGTSPASYNGPTGNLPDWLEIHKDRDLMASYLDFSRQRHAESVQKARESYVHGVSDDDTQDGFLDTLQFDEYSIGSAGKIPDFGDELERRLFVTSAKTPLFTAKECQEVVQNAEAHFQGGPWSTLPSGQYDVNGFWIRDVPQVHAWFDRMVAERLFPLLKQKFPHFVDSVEDLVVDNAYLFKYTPETGRRTDVHTDSGCLSFTIAMNGNDEYAGGGTWFEGLEGKDSNVIEMNVGQCTVRPGGVRHCGNAVKSGTRYVIGGFCMNVKKVEHVRMLMGLGSQESLKQNDSEAQQALEAAIALNPDFDGPYTHLANLLERQGDLPKAQKVLEHCFRHVNPQSGEVAYSLGAMYLDQGQSEHAKNCMEACLQADDCDIDAMMVMAQACAGQGDHQGEQAWYERLVSTPGASSEVAGKAFCNLGVLHEGTEKEIEFYEKSLQVLPDSFPTSYSLGCAYASQKDWDSAVAAFRKAVQAATNTEDESQALQSLYRVTAGKMQQDQPTGASSREEMIQQFMDIMGQENYENLVATRQ
jgi:tetratricopeptide (TPR) repeat protein